MIANGDLIKEILSFFQWNIFIYGQEFSLVPNWTKADELFDELFSDKWKKFIDQIDGTIEFEKNIFIECSPFANPGDFP